jgi:hypothetical protein
VEGSAAKPEVPLPVEEFLEPTWAQRWRILALLFASFVAWLAMKIYWRGFMAWIRAKPLCEETAWLRGLLVVAALLGALVVWTLAWRAWRIHGSGQNPPPGMLVFFRTRVRRGPWVQLDALYLVLLASAIATGVLWLASTEPVRVVMVESWAYCAGR